MAIESLLTDVMGAYRFRNCARFAGFCDFQSHKSQIQSFGAQKTVFDFD